jgi:hypothetical protein
MYAFIAGFITSKIFCASLIPLFPGIPVSGSHSSGYLFYSFVISKMLVIGIKHLYN